MFLKKLFNFGKDHTHYMEKGDRYLGEERFADARDAFAEALERVEENGNGDASLVVSLREKIAITGNMLGRLNLVEAEHAIAGGDRKKAGDHLQIVLDLADDKGLRERAKELLAGLDSEAPVTMPASAGHNCDDCKGGESMQGNYHGVDDTMSGEDRLALYFHTLPEDLPERYAGMGEKFARGCLLNLEGDEKGALRIFEEISADLDNDILDYEKAIIYYHNGVTGKCEELLRKAIDLNPLNPLCSIGLVHLYTETGRAGEALPVVERMIGNDLIPEQARLMQGDIHILLRDETKALESYSTVLASPKFAREAAERMVPLLENQGRSEEAAYLAKKYAKGCC